LISTTGVLSTGAATTAGVSSTGASLVDVTVAAATAAVAFDRTSAGVRPLLTNLRTSFLVAAFLGACAGLDFVTFATFFAATLGLVTTRFFKFVVLVAFEMGFATDLATAFFTAGDFFEAMRATIATVMATFCVKRLHITTSKSNQ